MARLSAKRQRLRKALLFISLLLFPLTFNYFSPYIILDGASQGVVNGSFLVFAGMFLSALFLGRLWCGWLCPGAGLQEVCFEVNDKRARDGRLDWIKWAIWIPWVAGIAVSAIAAGGYRRVDPLHLTQSGISIDRPEGFILYYIVVGLFLAPSLAWGRRAGCHYICWMAPFMVLGRKLRNFFAWPALRLVADVQRCLNCKKCTQNCPMSLDVNRMVQERSMENAECILCGTCADTCPQGVISYSFRSGASRPFPPR